MIKLWIDRNWINQISAQLSNFSWTSRNTANFRCPICGDSDRNQRKRRGYFFIHEQQFMMKCHNCSASMSFGKFLKEHFPEDYAQYKLDLFRESKSSERTVKEATIKDRVSKTTNATKKRITLPDGAHRLSDLNSGHPAVLYCKARKINGQLFGRIHYTANFARFVDKNIEGDYENLPEDERILFLLKERNGNIFGVQGRRIEPGEMRYITAKNKDVHHKMFGLEQIDFQQPVFVVEGPIDSLFLPNAIALCGGDVSASLEILPIDKENIYVCLDNEPRSKDTIHRMNVAIEAGYNVCFWQGSTDRKDINDLIKYGLTTREILGHIKYNSFRNLKAKTRMMTWKKIQTTN